MKKSPNSEIFWKGRFASKKDDDVLFDSFIYNWTKHHERYWKGQAGGCILPLQRFRISV